MADREHPPHESGQTIQCGCCAFQRQDPVHHQCGTCVALRTLVLDSYDDDDTPYDPYWRNKLAADKVTAKGSVEASTHVRPSTSRVLPAYHLPAYASQGSLIWQTRAWAAERGLYLPEPHANAWIGGREVTEAEEASAWHAFAEEQMPSATFSGIFEQHISSGSDEDGETISLPMSEAFCPIVRDELSLIHI